MPAYQGTVYCCKKYIPLSLPLDFITSVSAACFKEFALHENQQVTVHLSYFLLLLYSIFCLINLVGILNRSHVETDKKRNVEAFTLLLQRQADLEELPCITRKKLNLNWFQEIVLLRVKAFFWRTFYAAEKNNIFEKHTGVIQGETSPPATSTQTGTAQIPGTATDNNEDLDWWLRQTEGEGYLHYIDGAKVGLFRDTAAQKILGSCWP